MSEPVVVIVEWCGLDRPCLIWRNRQSHQQWLSSEVIKQMGPNRYAAFYATRAGDVWSIGQRCDGAKQQIKDTIERSPAASRPIGATAAAGRTPRIVLDERPQE